jgi:hypothetical protein
MTHLGEDAGFVELEGVVDEGTSEPVATDEHTPTTECGLRGKATGGTRGACGRDLPCTDQDALRWPESWSDSAHRFDQRFR